jgi:hypothetical protein
MNIIFLKELNEVKQTFKKLEKSWISKILYSIWLIWKSMCHKGYHVSWMFGTISLALYSCWAHSFHYVCETTIQYNAIDRNVNNVNRVLKQFQHSWQLFSHLNFEKVCSKAVLPLRIDWLNFVVETLRNNCDARDKSTSIKCL